MPLGSPQDETGILNERDNRFTLRRDGGGTWRLDISPSELKMARSLAGERVRVAGLRTEFDLIDVEQLTPDPRAT